MSRILRHGIGLFALACLLVPAVVSAQQPSHDDISSDEITKFAEILPEVKRVKKKYDKKMRNTYDREKVRALRREMLMEIDRKIVRMDGLSPERYEEITEAIQYDEKLEKKLRRRIDSLH